MFVKKSESFTRNLLRKPPENFVQSRRTNRTFVQRPLGHGRPVGALDFEQNLKDSFSQIPCQDERSLRIYKGVVLIGIYKVVNFAGEQGCLLLPTYEMGIGS